MRSDKTDQSFGATIHLVTAAINPDESQQTLERDAKSVSDFSLKSGSNLLEPISMRRCVAGKIRQMRVSDGRPLHVSGGRRGTIYFQKIMPRMKIGTFECFATQCARFA